MVGACTSKWVHIHPAWHPGACPEASGVSGVRLSNWVHGGLCWAAPTEVASRCYRDGGNAAARICRLRLEPGERRRKGLRQTWRHRLLSRQPYLGLLLHSSRCGLCPCLLAPLCVHLKQKLSAAQIAPGSTVVGLLGSRLDQAAPRTGCGGTGRERLSSPLLAPGALSFCCPGSTFAGLSRAL